MESELNLRRRVVDNMKKKRYKCVILGSEDHGKTTLHESIRKVTKLLKKTEVSIYPDCLSEKLCARELIPVLEQSESVILVISAQEGLNPDYRTCVLISRQFEIEKMIVYLNKADIVDDKALFEVQKEIFDLMYEYDYRKDNLSIYIGSALGATMSSSENHKASEYQSIIQLINNI